MRVARRVPFRERTTSVGCICALSEYALQFTIQNLYESVRSVQMRNVVKIVRGTVLQLGKRDTW